MDEQTRKLVEEAASEEQVRVLEALRGLADRARKAGTTVTADELYSFIGGILAGEPEPIDDEPGANGTAV